MLATCSTYSNIPLLVRKAQPWSRHTLQRLSADTRLKFFSASPTVVFSSTLRQSRRLPLFHGIVYCPFAQKRPRLIDSVDLRGRRTAATESLVKGSVTARRGSRSGGHSVRPWVSTSQLCASLCVRYAQLCAAENTCACSSTRALHHEGPGHHYDTPTSINGIHRNITSTIKSCSDISTLPAHKYNQHNKHT